MPIWTWTKKVPRTIRAPHLTLAPPQNMHCPFEETSFQKGASLIRSLSFNWQIWSNPETGREILVEEKASLCAKPETARLDRISSHLCSTLSMWWNRCTSPPIPPGVLPARFFFDASSLSSSATTTSTQCTLSSSTAILWALLQELASFPSSLPSKQAKVPSHKTSGKKAKLPSHKTSETAKPQDISAEQKSREISWDFIVPSWLPVHTLG